MSSITNLISVGVNGTGTANSVMKWLDADTATDSIITDNGTTIAIGGNLSVTGTVLDSSGDAGTAGQILSSTGTGTNWIDAASGGGTIDGSGTANRITKWLDADTITDSVIYDDGTSISIGTSVAPSHGVPGLTIDSTLNASAIQLGNNSGTGVAGGSLLFASSQNILEFYTYTGAVGSETYSQRMVINPSGNVGIGTSSPARKLHLYDTADTYLRVDRGAIQSLFGTDNVGTYIGQQGAYAMRFVTNATERMRITSGGVLCIGTTQENPIANNQSGAAFSSEFRRFHSSTAETTLGIGTRESDMVSFFKHNGTSTVFVGNITTNGSSTAYNTSSDYRLKENVVPMEGALDRVGQLNPTRFNFIGDEKIVDGFLAHQVQEVVPEAITGQKDAVDEKGNPIYQGIDQSKLVPLLTAAIQELRAEIETLKSQING